MLPSYMGPNGHWRRPSPCGSLRAVEPEPLLYRTKTVAVPGALADIVVEVRAIRRLPEEDDGEEEEEEE